MSVNNSLCYPLLKDFRKLSKKGNIIPVYREILADRDTPVSIFEKLSKGEKYAYLLESVEGSERWARFSFISSHPAELIKIIDKRVIVKRNDKIIHDNEVESPYEYIKSVINHYRPVEVKGLPRFWGGAVGYLGYETVRCIEDIPERHKRDGDIPDGIFMITDYLVAFDHVSHKVKVIACVNTENGIPAEKAYADAEKRINRLVKKILSPAPEKKKLLKNRSAGISSNVSRDKFMRSVMKAKSYIRSGDIIQAVISQRFTMDIQADPFDVYRSLRVINPSPYLFYLKIDGMHLVGSSPEILVRKEGRMAEVRPIAGTRKRGKNQAEDARLARELLSDPKELAEHVMLVDLARNDIGRVCKYKSIHLPELKKIEMYSHVMHIVSSVFGTLRQGKDAVDLLRATFPAGTVTGAPKIRAMEIINELEVSRRGPYAGAIGYISFDGNMDMAITIRTIVIKDSKACVQAGAGIVADSIPSREYVETKNKAAALIAAIRTAEKGLK